MTLEELRARQRELQATMADLANDATRAEEFGRMEREFRSNEREINMMIQERQIAATTPAEQRNPDAILREVLRGVRNGRHDREVTLATEINNSGAIQLNIHDIIDTQTEGLGLPASLNIVRGVTGNELYPVSINDVAMEEVGENVTLNDQKVDFDKLTVTARRAGLTVWVSNSAIDNAAFPLLSFVQNKFKKAEAQYLAEKIYSQAAFTGIKGGFSGLTSTGTITLDGNAYKNILKAVAAFTNKGFRASAVCLVMDATTEADLKATPKAAGQGGFIIENGKCAGYDYVVSHFINTTLNSDGKTLKDTADKFLGIGYFEYLAVQQHGTVRLTIDSQSADVARQNKTAIVLNTEYSITDLSQKINGNKTGKTMAFALYKVAEPAAATGA